MLVLVIAIEGKAESIPRRSTSTITMGEARRKGGVPFVDYGRTIHHSRMTIHSPLQVSR